MIEVWTEYFYEYDFYMLTVSLIHRPGTPGYECDTLETFIIKEGKIWITFRFNWD